MVTEVEQDRVEDQSELTTVEKYRAKLMDAEEILEAYKKESNKSGYDPCLNSLRNTVDGLRTAIFFMEKKRPGDRPTAKELATTKICQLEITLDEIEAYTRSTAGNDIDDRLREILYRVCSVGDVVIRSYRDGTMS